MNDAKDLKTFLSCPYNYRYFTEEEEDEQKLDNRNCTKCEITVPFSYGFDADECKKCGDLAGFVANSEEYVQYFYNLNCADYQPCEATNSCVVETEEEVEEKEDVFSGNITDFTDGSAVKVRK